MPSRSPDSGPLPLAPDSRDWDRCVECGREARTWWRLKDGRVLSDCGECVTDRDAREVPREEVLVLRIMES